MLYFSFKIKITPYDPYINIAILTLGVGIGWVLGTFASPDSPKEGERFTKLGTAVASFLSGYVLSKTDKAIDKFVNNEASLSLINSFRVIEFVVGLLAATMVTYILREYVLRQIEQQTSNPA
ncbi:hypothetical protein GCM10028821_30360 [Hymenobacter jeollabukensis]